MDREMRAKRKAKSGIVVSAKMQKTVVVRTETSSRHNRYNKIVTRAKKYYAHNELEGVKEGDQVLIMETRPLSKLKRWRVVEKVTTQAKGGLTR